MNSIRKFLKGCPAEDHEVNLLSMYGIIGKWYVPPSKMGEFIQLYTALVGGGFQVGFEVPNGGFRGIQIGDLGFQSL